MKINKNSSDKTFTKLANKALNQAALEKIKGGIGELGGFFGDLLGRGWGSWGGNSLGGDKDKKNSDR